MKALFERTYADVRSLCLRITRRSELADDLAQETYFRALRYAHTFQGTARFSTWVYRIARNVCLDHMNGVTPTLGLEEIAEPAAEAPTRNELLEQALAKLPDDQREALVLVRLHGISYEEVASVLGCTPGAARTRVCRALRHLRQIIHSLDPDHVL
jgi:RNA polymerase sigma-70 factor (ECF subfamily)